MNTLTILHGIFIVGSIKTWADKSQAFGSENWLDQIVSIASIFGALRFFWSFLLDKY
jgi:hypothetical protein